MTRRLLKQSTPAVESLVMADLSRGAALAINNAAIEADGTGNTPTGIVNTTGVGEVIVNPAGVPDWNEMVAFETEVDTDNAMGGSMSYVTTPSVVGSLKTTEKAANTAQFIMNDINGMANGYAVRRTSNIDVGRIVFGNWADLVLGMWGVLDVFPDIYTRANRGGLYLRVFQDIDIGVRHAESFSKNVLV